MTLAYNQVLVKIIIYGMHMFRWEESEIDIKSDRSIVDDDNKRKHVNFFFPQV